MRVYHPDPLVHFLEALERRPHPEKQVWEVWLGNLPESVAKLAIWHTIRLGKVATDEDDVRLPHCKPVFINVAEWGAFKTALGNSISVPMDVIRAKLEEKENILQMPARKLAA